MRIIIIITAAFLFSSSGQTAQKTSSTQAEADIILPKSITVGSEENGIFFPKTTRKDLLIDELSIYSRWGKLVFDNQNFVTNDSTEGWDGTHKDSNVEMGMYLYIIKYQGNKQQITKDGHLTVLK